MDTVSTVQLEQSLINMAVESWRFSKVFLKMMNAPHASESNRHANQLRYFQKKIKQNLEFVDLSLVDLEGQVFDIGMAVSAINIDDFAPEDDLLVEQMIEPLIMSSMGIKQEGTVILRKVKV